MARAIRWRPTRSDDGTPRPSRPGSVASTATGSRPCDPATEVARGSAMALTRSSAHSGRMGPHAPARPGRHGHLVLELTAEGLAPGSGWTAPGEHVHDLAHPARGWAELAKEPHVVRNRRRNAPPQARGGARPRPRCSGQKKLIEQAYTLGAQLGLSVWCEDEAGPFQAVPHPGVSWQPRGQPAQHPHEYIRGGTTKILTLFHPASGQVRLYPAARGTNAVLHPWLHPWLRERLSEILAELSPAGSSQDAAA